MWAVTALVQRHMGSHLHAPVPLPIEGLWGPCCKRSFSALRWARVWRALRGALVARVWSASCVASRLGVHFTGSEDAFLAR